LSALLLAFGFLAALTLLLLERRRSAPA